eukprot:765652-Hanusia_phi.AAC.1
MSDEGRAGWVEKARGKERGKAERRRKKRTTQSSARLRLISFCFQNPLATSHSVAAFGTLLPGCSTRSAEKSRSCKEKFPSQQMGANKVRVTRKCSGPAKFAGIITISFVVFSGLDSLIHGSVNASFGIEMLAKFFVAVLPLILFVIVCALLWLAIRLLMARYSAHEVTTGPSYAALSAMEAPEPYARMDEEKKTLQGLNQKTATSARSNSSEQLSDIDARARAKAEEEKRKADEIRLLNLEAAARKKAEEEEAARKKAEEAARKEEEAARKKEEAAARKKAEEEEEAARKKAEEEAARKEEEAAARKKAEEEEAARKKAEEEEEARKKEAEEE